MTALRRALLAATLVALTTSPALADGLKGTLGIEGEGLLVTDKVIAGISGYGFFTDFIGIDLGFGLIFLDEDRPGDPVDGTFLGSLMTAHLIFGVPITREFQIRVGTGVDHYALWGIDDEEGKTAMPVLVEARVSLGGALSAFIQPRYYLLSSEGLEPGVDVQGNEEMPFVVSVGVGGMWR